MKKLFYFIVLFFTFWISSKGQKLNCEDNVTYTTTENNTLLLPISTVFEDIHPYDIPGVKNTEETNIHHEFIDNDYNPQHEI